MNFSILLFSFMLTINISFQYPYKCNEELESTSLKDCCPDENKQQSTKYCCFLKMLSLKDNISNNFCISKSDTINHYFRKDDYHISIICDYNGSQITHDPYEFNLTKYEIINENRKKEYNSSNSNFRNLQNLNDLNDLNLLSYYQNKYRQIDYLYPVSKTQIDNTYPVYKTLKLPTTKTTINSESNDDLNLSLCETSNQTCINPCCKFYKR